MADEPTPPRSESGAKSQSTRERGRRDLRPEEVVRAAVRGTAALMTRTVGLQVVGFAAFIGIARLISPADFGLFAIALAVQQLCQFVVTAGLPASMIRQEQPPDPSEQRALAGFSLLIAVMISAAALLGGFAVLPLAGIDSTLGKLIGISCLALPVLTARMIPFALLARNLRFDRIALIDVVTRTALYVWALPAAAAGLGVYALASAIPVSALVSSALASRMQPWAGGFSLDLALVSRHLRFGAQVGTFRFLFSFFQFGFVTALAIVGSAAIAGFYGLTRRVLGIPFNVVGALQRVGLPAFARVEEGAPRARRMAQATAVSTVGLGAVLALLAGSAQPLISSVFGARWLPAADIMIFGAPGLLVFASMGSVIASRALADGDARSPLIAIGVQIVVSLGLTALLVPGLDAAGAGISLSAGYVCYAGVLLARFHDTEMRAAAWSMLRSLLVAAAAAGVGQLVRVGDGFVELAAALAASGAAWLLLALLLTRPELAALIRLRRHLGRAPRREDDPDLQPGPPELV